MIGPTTSDVHVNRPLTGMCVAFMQSLEAFQADNLAPIMPVDKKSDTYFKLKSEYFFTNRMRKRGVGARAIETGYGVTTDSYLCDVWAVSKPIDDQVRANEDTPLNSDRTAMKFVTRQERMNREQSFKSAFWATSIWDTDLAGGSSASAIANSGTFRYWSHADATPITDIDEAQKIIEKKTTMKANVLAIGREVWSALKVCPEILEKITGGSTSVNPAKITLAMVASLLDLEEIVVLGSVYNTTPDATTMTGDYVFGKQMLLFHRDTSLDIETATAMRTICWRQYAGTKNGVRILKWREEAIHSDHIEIESTYIHKVIASQLGVFWSAAVA